MFILEGLSREGWCIAFGAECLQEEEADAKRKCKTGELLDKPDNGTSTQLLQHASCRLEGPLRGGPPRGALSALTSRRPRCSARVRIAPVQSEDMWEVLHIEAGTLAPLPHHGRAWFRGAGRGTGSR